MSSPSSTFAQQAQALARYFGNMAMENPDNPGWGIAQGVARRWQIAIAADDTVRGQQLLMVMAQQGDLGLDDHWDGMANGIQNWINSFGS
jgi:hypothetical protein